MPSNPQLQSRAGYNYPAFLNSVLAVNSKLFKMTSSEQLLLEGEEGQVLLPSGPTFGAGGSAAVVYNNSGDAIDVDLVFVDEFGTETVLDTDSPANAASGTLAVPAYLYLTAGEQLIARVTSGNPLAGNGVRIHRLASKPYPGTVVDVQTYKLQPGQDVVVRAPQGAQVSTALAGLINSGSDAISASLFRKFDDGFEFADGAAVNINPGADDIFLELNFQDDTELIVRVAALPPSGYVLVKQAVVFPLNVFPASP